MAEVKSYKVLSLPSNPTPNSIYWVKGSSASDVIGYITDINGVPYPLKDLQGSGGITTLTNTDGNLVITGVDNKVINIAPALLSVINSALQSGANISELVNDTGYITSTSLPTKTSDLINDGSNGTSTYVETDELGATAFSNDYNDLGNLPTIPTLISNHSELNLDDGTNPHGTTKLDVDLGNVDNTSDLNKPISTATQTALDSKLDKVTTSGVERAYIINADGSQGTKATSELGTQNSDWFDWSDNSVITGWSTFALKKINCKLIDDCLFVNYNISGTSNSTSIKFTLPFVNKEPTTKFDSSGYNANAGVPLTTPARVQVPIEVNEVEILRDLAGASYTASGAKHVSGGFFMSVYKTSVFNKGIGGNNTSDVIARLADINSLKANLAIVMIGTNDWRIPISGSRRTPAQYKTNLTTIVNSLQANGSQVLLLQFPPIVGAESDYVCPFYGQPSGCDSNATAIPFREKIVEVVSEKSTLYLDINQAFLDIGQPTNLSTSYMQNFANRGYTDGVHPQPIGANFIAQKIADYLNANNLSYDRIVCIGDSITAGDGLTGLNTATGQTYPAQLKNILNS